MKVSDSTPVAGPDRAPAPQAPTSSAGSAAGSLSVLGAGDRVSIDASKGADSSIASARRSSATDRAARLQKLEASVRSGTYSPDPGRVAEQILSDAEVDARLQAIIGR